MNNIIKKINYYNEMGDICIGTFRIKDNIEPSRLEDFITEIYNNKLGLITSHIKGFDIETLILYFKTFDFEKLNIIYKESKKKKCNNISMIILEYFHNFTTFDSRIFCTSTDCIAILKASSNPLFQEQESTVLNTIINSKREIIIEDIINFKNNTKAKNKIKIKTPEYN